MKIGFFYHTLTQERRSFWFVLNLDGATRTPFLKGGVDFI